MRTEDFKKKTEDQLRDMADDCFAQLESVQVGDKPGLLLQAQFYMSEIEKRHDAKVVRRDLILELIIIALIVGEIVVGVVEGKSQAKILTDLQKSAVTTAAASQVQSAGLTKLVDEQTASLGSLTAMNTTLQESVRKTGDMSAAMQKQLAILRDEQAARQAELAKKPKLDFYVGGLLLNSTVNVPVQSKEITTTKVVLDIAVRNSGTLAATQAVLRIIAFGKDVKLNCSSTFQPLYESQEDSPQHGIIVPIEFIRPGINIPMSVTATYPVGQASFIIYFNVDSNELPAGTPLGGVTVTPPTQ